MNGLDSVEASKVPATLKDVDRIWTRYILGSERESTEGMMDMSVRDLYCKIVWCEGTLCSNPVIVAIMSNCHAKSSNFVVSEYYLQLSLSE